MKSYKALNRQVFTSGEYSIVPIRSEDRYLIMQWRNEQIYHLRQNKPLTREDQDNYFENVVSKLFDQDKPDQLLFSFLKNGQCIGYGGLVHIEWTDRHAEISFIMDPSFENTSFETYWRIFLNLIEQVGFHELKLHKLFTYAFDLRPKLYEALESAGFVKDAILLQHVLYHGLYKNVVIHSKLHDRVWLRVADIYDTELTFKWASDKNVRQYAFNTKSIDYNEHSKWFKAKTQSKNCLYFILENATNKIGSIRLDFDETNNATISYLIDPTFHGKGYGKIILIMALNRLKELGYNSLNIIGFVKSENIASVKIFEKLEFTLTENKNNVLKFEKDLASWK
jgi:RimJ/RimL family protein N-acetyltransferase